MDNPPEERNESDAVAYDFAVLLLGVYKKQRKPQKS